ncbi:MULTISPECIES: hypothetical protein [unclassified Oleiphilus]|uniref:hypothetical protein n=2 Tax=Oleiphilus TaxID=141450 RepID=UPI0007C25086|nr:MULTISPECIES: hypothetical protein [unclassified Oleiphilus]KZY47830.1 hypothetical protein A3732_00795 [Oleiphilus sp. HI0050]KZY76542.1 hypothetical protein A3740_01835 [Oleiphilus sp. HI0068]KZY77896.1 hypothetical protein A3741_01475 [Oleiphilus sp. HI0069]KZY88726.1 hypothetical protein A3743_10770 [Oleiphilus sp. HI0072]KZZ11383.1 hypothetical protein A3749_09065 [Oleiphilus sp. HI0078]KZZ30324.1 hypothetical protein A3752_00015 [Oleiphilus sp. HI0081]KZZ46190.1 hypothetical protein
MLKRIALFVTILMLFSSQGFAGGDAPYPADWRSWTSVSTPLTSIGALPGCDADVSSLPPIYQGTVETYCGVRPEGPGAVSVLVEPSKTESYKTKDGKMADGASMILHLKELGILLVTGHKSGDAVYSVFKEDGTDITAADPASPLSVETCSTCHSGYEAFCVKGQCASGQ